MQPIPYWLVEQQNRLRHPPASPAPAKKPAKKKKEKDKDKEKEVPDNDFIMVDLLDGAHLETKTKSPKNKTMSSNSDSIISLPPMDDSNSSRAWKDLKAEAQQMRKTQRGGLSYGGVNNDHLASLRKKPQKFLAPSLILPPTASPNHGTLPRNSSSGSFHNPNRSSEIEPNVPPMPPIPPLSTKPPRNRTRAQDIISPSTNQPSILHHHSSPLQPHSPANTGTHSRSHSRTHSRLGSGTALHPDHIFAEETRSIATSSTSERTRRNNQQHHRGEHFRPGVWGWRMPGEDAIMPSGAWLYLPLIGFLTFFIAYCVSTAVKGLSLAINPVAQQVSNIYGDHAGVAALALLRGISLVVSFLFVLKVAPEYTAGSGIPEMKCVLSGVLMPRMLNLRTLIAKMVGLSFATASAISIGKLGPFIHMSGITAALVSKIPWFPQLRTSARYQLQALSAAIAAGVGATFGAPIGGTMLSIELMSTYYYIHWLPMALYCSIMGYYCVITIFRTDEPAFFQTNVGVHLEVESMKRLLTYVILGAICGVVGACLVKFTKYAFIFRKKYFKNSTPGRTTVMLFVFAVCHSLLTSHYGGVLALPQKNGVVQLFNSSRDDQNWISAWSPFGSPQWDSVLSLAVALAIKFFLTGLSLVMPVPAGTFMPIFEIGALVGRTFGEICEGLWFVNWVDARATAIIGAAAVTTGTLHTVAVAVVMLELTREAIDILPLTVGVIVSYGISKQLCSDLFSELIKIRRLPFILGLRERYSSENKQFHEDASQVVAGSFMWKDFPYVTPETTKAQLVRLLTQNSRPWTSCAFLSDNETRRLWGTVSQRTLMEVVGEDIALIAQSPGADMTYGTFGRSRRLVHLEEERIPFLENFDPKIGHALVDMGPMQVSTRTPFWKVITFFTMLSMSQMYVLEDGKTVGCLTRDLVIRFAHETEERAKKRRKKEKQMREKQKREERHLIEHFRRQAQKSRIVSRPTPADLVGLVGHRSRRDGLSRY